MRRHEAAATRSKGVVAFDFVKEVGAVGEGVVEELWVDGTAAGEVAYYGLLSSPMRAEC